LACGQGIGAFGDSGTGELAASLLQSEKSLLHLITVFVFAAVSIYSLFLNRATIFSQAQ